MGLADLIRAEYARTYRLRLEADLARLADVEIVSEVSFRLVERGDPDTMLDGRPFIET